MPNNMRWRYGDTNPVMTPVDAATVIEIGDLVYFEADDARPAAAQADQGTESINQQVLHDKFLGVAMQASPAGEDASIRVATSGVFEFACDTAAFELGALVGVAENDAGSGLENQKVVEVSAEDAAIGRCVRRVQPSGPRVMVDITSTTMHGGVQAAA